MKISFARTGVGLLALALAGCAVHETYAFRGAVIVIDRGISIPTPPPSLSDAPAQKTDVEGDVDFQLANAGADAQAALHLRDRVSGLVVSTPVEPPADTFLFSGVLIDHSDNCLELWLEAAGEQSTPVLYHTIIAADDQSVEVVEGCLE